METVSFYNWQHLDWVRFLQSQTEVILEEVQQLLKKESVNTSWFEAHPHYVKSEVGQSWKTFELIFFGMDVVKNMQACPRTAEILGQIPELITADFSLLPAKTTIMPHKGYSRMILRSHLPLIVPKGDLGIKVNNEVRTWKKGELITFDDSLDHEAWNNSDSNRLVMMLDVPNPVMKYSKDEICKYKIDNLDDPFLLSLASKSEWQEMYRKKRITLF